MGGATGRIDEASARLLVRIEWLPRADRDRASQIAYIGERNPLAAVALGDAVEVALRRLTEHPASGRPGRVLGTRELVVSGSPYILVYRLEASAILILRMLHGAQRWPAPSG